MTIVMRPSEREHRGPLTEDVQLADHKLRDNENYHLYSQDHSCGPGVSIKITLVQFEKVLLLPELWCPAEQNVADGTF